jgi:hypothetical protein
VRSLLSDGGFLIALGISMVGASVVVVARRAGSWPIGFGYVALVAALVAMRADLHLGARLVVGLLLLVIAGATPQQGVGAVLRAVTLVTGAAFVVAAMTGASGWMRVLGFVMVLAAVPPTGAIDRRAARLVPVLLLVAAIGVYICAPDTEYAKILVGALAPLALLVFEPRLTAAAPSGAVSALVVWAAVVEGRGRNGAVVGALACVAVVLLLAATRWSWRRASDAVAAVAIDAVAVLYLARVAGFRASAWVAALLALPVLLLTWVALALLSRRR